jgi:hypothetical protein
MSSVKDSDHFRIDEEGSIDGADTEKESAQCNTGSVMEGSSNSDVDALITIVPKMKVASSCKQVYDKRNYTVHVVVKRSAQKYRGILLLTRRKRKLRTSYYFLSVVLSDWRGYNDWPTKAILKTKQVYWRLAGARSW